MGRLRQIDAAQKVLPDVRNLQLFSPPIDVVTIQRRSL